MNVIYGTHVSNDNISRRSFYFLKMLIFRVLRRVKGQERVQMTKNSVRHAPYLRNHTSYDCHLWYTFEK